MSDMWRRITRRRKEGGEIGMTRRKCENCGSIDKVKVGKDSEGRQRWLCRKCEEAGRTPKYQ